MKLEQIFSALNETKELANEIKTESSENFLLKNLEKIKNTSPKQANEELYEKIEKNIAEAQRTKIINENNESQNVDDNKLERRASIVEGEIKVIKLEGESEKFKDILPIEKIKTINESKEGHEVEGVPFERKLINVGGKIIEGVFPKFEPIIDIDLPEEMYKESDKIQMKYCTKELQKEIESNPDLAKKFTPRQLEQIKAGEPKISGLTWHHNEEPGKMQLVSQKEHDSARHTGGRNIWGGGSENR